MSILKTIWDWFKRWGWFFCICLGAIVMWVVTKRPPSEVIDTALEQIDDQLEIERKLNREGKEAALKAVEAKYAKEKAEFERDNQAEAARLANDPTELARRLSRLRRRTRISAIRPR